MSLAIHLLQTPNTSVGINLGSRKTRMTQQFLHAPNIGTPIE